MDMELLFCLNNNTNTVVTSEAASVNSITDFGNGKVPDFTERLVEDHHFFIRISIVHFIGSIFAACPKVVSVSDETHTSDLIVKCKDALMAITIVKSP